jgi:hypothetical protein
LLVDGRFDQKFLCHISPLTTRNVKSLRLSDATA